MTKQVSFGSETSMALQGETCVNLTRVIQTAGTWILSIMQMILLPSVLAEAIKVVLLDASTISDAIQ
jgi:hypothetical protein